MPAKKNRGRIGVTYEMMKSYLGVPEDVELIRVEDDPENEIVRFALHSTHPVTDWTYPTHEGASILSAKGTNSWYLGEEQEIPEAWLRIHEIVERIKGGRES